MLERHGLILQPTVLVHPVVMEQQPIDFVPRAGLHHSTADVSLTVAHRRETEISEDLLDVLVAVVYRDTVEGVQH